MAGLDKRIAKLEGLAAEREARLVELEAQLAERDAETTGTLAGRRFRVAELEAELAERDARSRGAEAGHGFRHAEQELRVAQGEARLEKLEHLVEKLQERLGLNSSNSSLPPSTDRGKNAHRNKRKAKRKKGARNKGGQKGHKRHLRELLPPEQVTAFHDHFPERCGDCAKDLPQVPDPDPLRHQVIDMPKQAPLLDEHRLHSVMCACGCETRAKLPADVPTGAFGPRLVAAVALLTGLYRLSKRNVRRVLGELFGIEMSLGSVSGCERLMGDALEAPHAELHEHIESVPVVHADETSWRQGHVGHWLWVACTSTVAFFMIQGRRTAVCAKALLGKAPAPTAVLVTDRLSSYAWWPGPRQVCWAHLLRMFQGLAEKKKGCFAQIYGSQLLDLTNKMFKWWHRVQEGKLSRSTFRRYMVPVRKQMKKLLEDASTCSATGVEGKAKTLLRAWDSLWTFIELEGVEPTNNDAERDLRHAVIMRRTSFGTDSPRGSRFIERMLSAVETLRKQDRDVLGFLIDAHRAHRDGRPSPSLVPRLDA